MKDGKVGPIQSAATTSGQEKTRSMSTNTCDISVGPPRFADKSSAPLVTGSSRSKVVGRVIGCGGTAAALQLKLSAKSGQACAKTMQRGRRTVDQLTERTPTNDNDPSSMPVGAVFYQVFQKGRVSFYKNGICNAAFNDL